MLRTLLVLCPLFLTMLALSLAKVRAQSGKQEEIQSPRAECVLGNISLEHAVSQPRRIELTINTCTENLQKELQVCKGPQVLEANYHGPWSGPQSGWGREQDTHASTGLSRHVVEELQLTYVLMNWTDSCPPCPHLIYPGLGPTQMFAHSCVHSFLCVFQELRQQLCLNAC